VTLFFDILCEIEAHIDVAKILKIR